MADRVHPESAPINPPEPPTKPSPQLPEKPVPPPGTYVIQIPKDQVYRVPPPENASRFQRLSRRKPRRSRCRCCCCFLLGFLVSLVILSLIAAGVFYLVFRPESPHYSIDSMSIKNFNVSSSSPISPEFDVTVRADNPNNKIGIDYVAGSLVSVLYEEVKLSSGSLPVFYQGKNNVTVFTRVLKGTGIAMTREARGRLIEEATKGAVPLKVDLKVPVKIKVGSVKTWKITVNVDCEVTVDKLTEKAKIVSKKCDYGVDVW